ncbi:MAG: lipopolysaccharide biosynthesis protein, partial [Peptostreptococcaceae bacterium]|nr:lipopolysaccharide biosynthesis protein [Peptostreptococcaceae bacterium]
MEAQMIAKKVNIAAKWSLLTQIGTKLITPITNMILARLLAPEAFGVVATINMVISFVDMFTDAGFQKYLVQNEFSSDKEKYESTNVAFITNLSISIIIWGVIIICRDNIAVMLGNPGLGNVLAIACIQLPMTSFSSIQMALYRRNFDFKSLFNINMVRALIPLIVSVPLAKLGFSYWSIIIGSTLGILYNAIVLTIKSDWKPSLFFDFNILKKMFGFSFWSLLEAISIWLTSWIDALIIGSILTPYYLGLYKTSLSLVNSVIMIISGSICPVLFSALSRIQNDDEKSKSIFYKIQKIVAYFAFPIGVGMFIYSDFITITMLGEQWIEASKVVGIWSLTSAFRLVLTSIYSEVYRAKGKPKISL